MQSQAASVEEYIAELPDDRREAVRALRDLINANLQPGFEEGMQYGMIGWHVPHSTYPAGYHCDPRQPVPFVALASQKNHLSLYMMGLYTALEEEQFRREWTATGRKLNMGKSCVRFKKLKDAALEVISGAIRRISVEEHLRRYEEATSQVRKGRR